MWGERLCPGFVARIGVTNVTLSLRGEVRVLTVPLRAAYARRMTKPLPARNAPGSSEALPEVPIQDGALPGSGGVQGPKDDRMDGPIRASARVVPLRVREDDDAPDGTLPTHLLNGPAEARAVSGVAGPVEPSESRELAIGGQRMRLLYGAGVVNLGVTVAVAFALSIGLWIDTPSSRMWLWFGGILAVSCARFGLLQAFRRAQGTSAQALVGDWRRWHGFYIAGSAASGLMWGSAAVLLPLETPLQQILSLFIIGGLLAGSIAAFVASVPAYFAFVLPILGGLGVVLIDKGGAYTAPILVPSVFIVGVMSLYLRRLHRSLIDSIMLQFQNQTLIARMARMNEELEERVVSRTAELRRANRNLELDIEARRKAEQALRDSEQRYRALYDDNPSMFLTLDREGSVLSINQFGASSLGYEVDEVRGRLWYELLDEPYRQLGRRRVGASFDKPGSVQYAELRVRLAGGGTRWLRVASRALENSGDSAVPSASESSFGEATERALRVLLVCQDISEARTLSEKLSYHATHDPLTGLANRREFESRLRRALRRVGEPGRKYALCYLDLDQFKVINDTCGHAAGDELLRRIALTLGERLRKRDTLARLGGDEFGILMENCEPAAAHRIANGLREAVAEFRFPWEGKSFSLGVSIGLVSLDQDMVNLSQALRAADSACYVAKDLGRNRIHVYSKNDTELDRRRGEIQWVERLQSALEQDRFRLAYQLIAPAASALGEGLPLEPGSARRGDVPSDMRSSEAAAAANQPGGDAQKSPTPKPIVELLLRMLDEQGDIVHPRSFLAAAERYNLATPIDRWVTANAFKWFAANRGALEKLDYCFINLSGRSLGDTSFLRFIREQLRETELPPEKFCFEVTETAAIANLMDARRFMRALRGIGCSFALDDFGSGLSSFAYLKDLPVEFIKIDGVFSKDVEHNPVQRAMIKSINEVGHVMGKRTIAEWVETGPAIDTLREIGVDYIQGYASGGPQPLESLMMFGLWP